MALKIFEKFDPRANPIDGNYPTGSIKNESVPGANDGTPLDAEWGNDEIGFTDALLNDAEITHSGNPDTVVTSDRLDALRISANKAAQTPVTLSSVVADIKLKIGMTRIVSDRDNGIFDVVLASTVIIDGIFFITCVGAPTLALALRVGGVVKLKQLGIGIGGDDTAGFLAAIATGKTIWGYNTDTYRISSRLTFNQDDQKLIGGFKLLYVGPNTDRLFDITADNFTAKNIKFDGNLSTVRFALGYIAKDTKDTVFSKCHFQNMRGTAKGSTVLNQQYGLCIDYDTVENINIDTCTFRNLVSVNTTANGGAIEGQGFVGGIVVSTENGQDPVITQTFPSYGKISNCTFDKIVTELDEGLNQTDRNTFDDGDAIRFYGVTGKSERANFQVSDCHFNQCSKRAIKSAMQGVTVNDITIVADSNVYPMTTIVKSHNNNDFSGVIVHCKDSLKRPDIFTQIFYTNQSNENGIKFSNINCPYVGVVLDLICESAGTNASNIYVEGVNCPDVTLRAFSQSGVVPASIDINVDNVTVTGTSTDTKGVVPFNGGWHFGKVIAKNMDWKGVVGGTIGDLSLTIDSGSFTGTGTDRLVEINGNNIGKLSIDATALSSSFLTPRTSLVLIQGDGVTLDHLVTKVNESMSQSKPHIEWTGNDSVITRWDHDGAGYMDIGSLIISDGLEVSNATRKGVNTTSTSPFILSGNTASDNIVIGQLVDFIDSTAASIRLVSGLKMVIANAMSRSVLNVTQDDTAGNMTVVNQTGF